MKTKAIITFICTCLFSAGAASIEAVADSADDNKVIMVPDATYMYA